MIKDKWNHGLNVSHGNGLCMKSDDGRSNLGVKEVLVCSLLIDLCLGVVGDFVNVVLLLLDAFIACALEAI